MSKHYSTVLQDDTRNTYEVSRNHGPGYLHMQSFTVWTAPAGTVRSDGAVSRTGHVFITVEHFTENGYQQESIGFSPGNDWGTSRDNMSYSDIADYPGASSHQFSSYNANFAGSIETMLSNINGFKNGTKTPPDYDLKDNNCIDFVQDFLEAASVNITLAATPNGVLEDLKDVGDAYFTPIVIDLNGDGVQTLSRDIGVTFDFEGDGERGITGWASGSDGLLVLDRNLSGSIENGSELFGEHTMLTSGSRAKDGFEALGELDTDSSGVIDQSDAAWTYLSIWQDVNENGVSDQGEVRSLQDLGISGVSLKPVQGTGRDSAGNVHALESTVSWADGRTTQAVDVLFRQAQGDWGSSGTEAGRAFIEAADDGFWRFDSNAMVDHQLQLA